MAPMPLTGTIGATLTSNAELQAVSSRKALPDQVTSFSLPTIERPEKVAERKRQIELQKRNTSKRQKSGRISSIRPAKLEDETGSEQDEEEVEENLLDLEKSLILLQSLRQSRLAMLSSMLPYLSTRHRTSTKYHPPPKDHPFPGGLDPSIMPPTLLNLGRADVRIGPFVFPQTRFSEARVEGGIQDIEGASLLRGGQSDPSTTPIKTPAKKRQRKPKTPKTNDTSIEDRSLIRDGDDQPSTSLMSTNATPTPVKASTSGVSTPSTSAIPMQSTPTSKPSDPAATESTSETPVRAPPVPAPGTPPINEKVVKAVSAAAQNDPALQTLLYVAANNKASPDQLRELAAFIAKVSAGLEKVEREQLEQRKKEEEEQAKMAAKKAARAAEAKARRAAKKAAALEEASKKVADDSVGAIEDEEKDNSGEAIMEDESMDISTTTHTTTKFVPPPSANKVPSYPPIVIVEFRENPSARFVLPLWRDAIVERRKEGGECSVKVSLLLPSIGSSAALRASDENSNSNAQVGKGKKSKNTTNKQNTPTNPDEEGQSKDTFSPTNPPTEKDLKKAAPQGAETRLMTWTIDGTSESPISDALWNIFGRVVGAKTIVDGVEEEQKPMLEGSEELTTSKLLPDDVIGQVIAKIHALPASNQDDNCLPKLRLRPEEIPRDLPDHLSDKFAPKIQTLASRPIYRMKRTNQGDEEDSQFDVLRNHNIYANNMMMKRIQIKGSAHLDDDDEGADTSMGLDGGGDEMMGYVGGDSSLLPNQKPKRKRHVAKFNEDGTLKLCQACGTNSTPMWRRGPAGKSTLCNACGAKWKVGRLIVPDHPPTIPLKEEKNTQNVNKKEVEEDQSKKVEESKAQASTTISDVQMQERFQSESTEKGKEKEKTSPPKDDMIVLI